METTITFGIVETPAGVFGAAFSGVGLGRLAFAEEGLAACEAWARRWLPQARVVSDRRRVDDLAEQLTAYFEGRLRAFAIPLDLRGTAFQREVWRALLGIGYGDVSSYSALATALGRPLATRAVGAANGANPIPILVPCHRLVSKDGTLVKYGGGLDLKRRLLELEGVSLGKDRGPRTENREPRTDY